MRRREHPRNPVPTAVRSYVWPRVEEFIDRNAVMEEERDRSSLKLALCGSAVAQEVDLRTRQSLGTR